MTAIAAPMGHPDDEGLSRERLVDLVLMLRKPLRLSEKAVLALRLIARSVPWTTFRPGQNPVCYRAQDAMAFDLSVNARSFRRFEDSLERAGLLNKETPANGFRGTVGYGERRRSMGLALGPLIERGPQLEAMHREREAARRAIVEGRAEIKIARGRLRRALRSLPDDHDLRATHDRIRKRWETPGRYDEADEIDAHLVELRSQIEEVQEAAGDLQTDLFRWNIDVISSDAPDSNDLRHTETHHEAIDGSCTAESEEHVEGRRARGAAGPKTTSPGRADQARSAGLRSSLTPDVLGRLTLDTMHALASEEARLYLDGARATAAGRGAPAYGRNALQMLDFVAEQRRRDLEVKPSLWDEVEDALGWFDAVLALLIADRKRTHPDPAKRVRNVGGYLRALGRRGRQGKLDLGASVRGMWKLEP